METKKHILFIALVAVLAVTLTGCYGHKAVGLLQERKNLPQYDSAAWQPYRLQVNDEIIYRVITMDASTPTVRWTCLSWIRYVWKD